MAARVGTGHRPEYSRGTGTAARRVQGGDEDGTPASQPALAKPKVLSR